MISSRQLQLDRAVAALHQRWGPHSLTPLAQLAQPANGIATGFAALDALLGPAVIPLGALTELFGQPTSGTTTFAYHLIGQAQAGGRYAVYLDLDGTFDPEAAQRAGMALDRVLLAQPESDVRALDLARDLLASGEIGIIALDLGQMPADEDRLYRLTTLLLHAQAALLRVELLPPGWMRALPPSPARLRLRLERLRWHEAYGVVIGCRTRVHVVKGHGVGQHADIDLRFESLPEGLP